MGSSLFRSAVRSTPCQILLCILFAGLFGKVLPIDWIRGAYTISLFFIDVVLFILPVIIFSYMFNALISLDENGPLLFCSLLVLICLSNALALCFAYGVARLAIPHLAFQVTLGDVSALVTPYLRLPLKHGIRSDLVAVTALILAFLCVKTKTKFMLAGRFVQLMQALQAGVGGFLQKAFLPLLPLYVLGFMLKMAAEGSLTLLYTEYLPIFALNVGVSFIYVIAFYKLASHGYPPLKNLILNMLPAGITGFSTMSGAVTMPVTLNCTEKNVANPVLARMVIPTASNMHMLGDDITITLTALTLVVVSGAPLPSFIDFLPYVAGFCIAKLACVGLAGASLLVVLPVLKEHLGFSSEMVSLITTLYVLHDPFGTFHNVMGNGAFAIAVEKLFVRLGLIKSPNNKSYQK